MRLDERVLAASHNEAEMWAAVCRELVKSGAVTRDDLTKSMSQAPLVFCAIRAWGDALYRLHKVMAMSAIDERM